MENTKLNTAFKQLRALGYFARQNLADCQSCSLALIPEEKKDKYVYYHTQDKENLDKTGSCFIGFAGNGYEICGVFGMNGITTKWDGKNETRIRIVLPKEED